jgi:hypothetical protein
MERFNTAFTVRGFSIFEFERTKDLPPKEKSDMIFLVPWKRDEKLEIVKERGEAAQIKFFGASPRRRRPLKCVRTILSIRSRLNNFNKF